MTMKHQGGELARGGIYLSWATKEFVTIEGGGGRLPGESNVAYLRVPFPALVLFGPLMGLIYVIFMPIVGPAMLIGLAAYKGALRMQSTVRGMLEIATLQWRPGEAYFSKLKRQSTAPAPEVAHEAEEEKKGRLAKLEEETAAKRKEDKD